MSKSNKFTYEQIISDLKKKVYHPVYFLEGEETYFIDTITDYIAENTLNEAEKEFNQTILYGKDVDIFRILNEAKRFPMMAERQVVIIKEAQHVNKLEELETYLQHPLKSTILVICYKYKELDKRKTIAKTIAKSGVLFTSEKLYENKIPDWIERYTKEKNIAIHPKASLLLAEYLGNDLSRIVNEIDKLLINKSAKGEINLEDVQGNIGISKDFNVFELQNAITKKEVVKANRIINYFSANPREHPLSLIIATLYSYFSKIMVFHSLKDKSQSNVASALKVHPFFVKEYEMAARNYSLQKLIKIVSYLREYDTKSKGIDTGYIPDGELMKELLFKILH